MDLPKYQVFVSSTYDDLRQERNAVIKAILEMGHIPVGMEMFSAADEQQWQIITRHIDNSDYYCVIVAHRYGSMIDGMGYTQKEYEYAVSQGVPVLGFVIDTEAEWPGRLIDRDPTRIEKLHAFREMVCSRPVSFWRNADDLYGRVAVALNKQITSTPRVGWIRASKAITPETIQEFTRLSHENAQLREKVALLQADEPSDKAILDALDRVTVSTIERPEPDTSTRITLLDVFRNSPSDFFRRSMPMNEFWNVAVFEPLEGAELVSQTGLTLQLDIIQIIDKLETLALAVRKGDRIMCTPTAKRLRALAMQYEVPFAGQSAALDAAKNLDLRRLANLPQHVCLADLKPFTLVDGPTGGCSIPIGMTSQPGCQAPITFRYSPAIDGNMIVLGSPTSGKSTLLRALAVAALEYPPSELTHVYCIDGAGGALLRLRSLPNVGAVVSAEQIDMIDRMTDWLERIYLQRLSEFARLGCSTLSEYTTRTAASEVPRIVVLIDGLGYLFDRLESPDGRQIRSRLARLIGQGRGAGIHFVASLEDMERMPSLLRGGFHQHLVLKLTDRIALHELGIPDDAFLDAPIGRAIQGGSLREIQLASIASASEVQSERELLEALIADRFDSQRAKPQAFSTPPTRVLLADLPMALGGEPTLGITDEGSPLAFLPQETFLIAGQRGSGRTNALMAVAASMHRFDSRRKLVYVSRRKSGVTDWPHWEVAVTETAHIADLVSKLIPYFATERSGPNGIALFLENVEDFESSEFERPLADLAVHNRMNQHFIAATLGSSSGSFGYSLLMSELRQGGQGLVLGAGEDVRMMVESLFRNVAPRRYQREDVPPGRGYYVRNGRSVCVQMPIAE